MHTMRVLGKIGFIARPCAAATGRGFLVGVCLAHPARSSPLFGSF